MPSPGGQLPCLFDQYLVGVVKEIVGQALWLDDLAMGGGGGGGGVELTVLRLVKNLAARQALDHALKEREREGG